MRLQVHGHLPRGRQPLRRCLQRGERVDERERGVLERFGRLGSGGRELPGGELQRIDAIRERVRVPGHNSEVMSLAAWLRDSGVLVHVSLWPVTVCMQTLQIITPALLVRY